MNYYIYLDPQTRKSAGGGRARRLAGLTLLGLFFWEVFYLANIFKI
jgi:hypothetical protein